MHMCSAIMQIHGTTADKQHVIRVHWVYSALCELYDKNTNGKWVMLWNILLYSYMLLVYVDFCMGDRPRVGPGQISK